MKNRKTAKLLIMILSLALLIGSAVGIAASAETAAPEIISQNVVYGGTLNFKFAIDATNLGEDKTVTVNIYDKNPADDGAVLLDTTTAVYEDVSGTNLGVDYAYIATSKAAISALDYGTEYYAQAVCDGVAGEAIKYSAVEYFLTRLYREGETVTDIQREHYENVLAYGSTTQKVTGDTETNVADYRYVAAKGGNIVVDGNAIGSSAILVKDTAFTIQPTEAVASGYVARWKGADGSNYNSGAVITATASTTFTKTLIPMLTFEGMNDATVTISSSANVFTTFGSDYATYNKAFRIYNGAPAKNPPNSSIVNEKLVINSDDGSDYIRIFPTYTEDGYNHATFEADITINGTGSMYPILYEEADTSKVFQMKTLSYNASTGEFKFAPTNASTSTGLYATTTLPTEGENAHTVNLKIDVYELDGDVLILFYLNGTLSYIIDSRLVTDENVTKNFNYKNTDGVPMSAYYGTYNVNTEGKETPFTQFSIFSMHTDGGFKGTLSFDNVLFTQTVTNEIPVVNTTLK